MAEPIRQCWAFHRDGARCEHPAGHPGDHIVMKTWTDLECATPGEFSDTPKPIRSNPEQQHLNPPLSTETAPVSPVPPPPPVDNCVACGHKHRGGPCKCNCYEFVG